MTNDASECSEVIVDVLVDGVDVIGAGVERDEPRPRYCFDSGGSAFDVLLVLRSFHQGHSTFVQHWSSLGIISIQ